MSNKWSETTGKIAEALSKVQGGIKPAKRTQSNPFFKSTYADLASCYEACSELLSKNGIAIFQGADSEAGDVDSIVLDTTLLHVSGEWITSSLRMPLVKKDPQAVGSLITYARRYALCAAIGLASEDDDAESAMPRNLGTSKTSTISKKYSAPKVTTAKEDIHNKLIKTLYYYCCNEENLGFKKEEIAPFIRKTLGREDIEGMNDVSAEELTQVIAEAKALIAERRK